MSDWWRDLGCAFLGHKWREASGMVRRHCARCGFTPGEGYR